MFHFDNTYARELSGLGVPWKPAVVPQPRLLFFNHELAAELQLGAVDVRDPDVANLFAGNAVPDGSEPIAQAYAGHQFGGFSPQLGDGRALLLGEVMDRFGRRRDIAFKGSGRTPFARGGDGKAAVGPMLREVLVGEAMHALGVPTTRALAVVATGEAVVRERMLPGAVLTRVAASHLRVGTFQFVAVRGAIDRLRELLDYAIARHDPELSDRPDRALAFLQAVASRQAELVARWMNVGFIHGVMNTDNMTVSGETIDYGPCAFLEGYDPATVFSSIDHGGRYAYGNQPAIARWNLARLAETLLPLIHDDPDTAVARAVDVIDGFPAEFQRRLLAGQRAKLGLPADDAHDPAGADAGLVDAWLEMLRDAGADFTLAWRHLADAAEGDEAALRGLVGDQDRLAAWLARWRARCRDEDADEMSLTARAARMRRVNPRIIPRNHRVEEALAAASDDGDMAPFERLLAALRSPYDESQGLAIYAEPASPAVTAGYRTFCGT